MGGILSQPATGNEIEITKRNRSLLAFLETKQFDAALSDTDFSPTPTEKSLFRAAKALYNIEKFSKCCQVLEQLRTNFSQTRRLQCFLNMLKVVP